MRKLPRLAAVALVAAALAASAHAQFVGTTLRDHRFEGFQNTKVTSLDDLAGRLVVLELFAYW